MTSAVGSIVIKKSAPSAASSGLAATIAPSSERGSAFSRVRFHTPTSNPASSRFLAIAAPMIPVPSTAILVAITDPPDSGHSTPDIYPPRSRG